MKTWAQFLILAFVLIAGVGGIAFDRWIDRTVLPSLHPETSRTVVDRDGVLLRAYAVADGRWRLPVTMEKIDQDYIAQLIVFEDKRFRTHSGIDPIALARAVAQAVWNGKIISGGSTLTMQTARLLEEGQTGQLSGKLRQIRVALALERHLSKDEILALYLQLAPFGGNIEGVRSASLTWFGKEPGRLTPAEAALLVALPQSPETRRPDRFTANAEAARNHVLERGVTSGLIPQDEAAAAMSEPVPNARHDFPLLAPHLSDRLLASTDSTIVDTTIDAQLQADLEKLVLDNAHSLDPHLSTAIIVANHRTGEILAEIGSADFLDTARLGFVDMTRAIRSPGSTLKPLIYGLAFEGGIAHPETLIDDRPTSFGTYTPQNFDHKYRGTVSVRQALQLSLNIPAVALLDAVGPAQLLARMRRVGIEPVLPLGHAPGLAIGLGGIGLSLHDLVAIYAAIAHGGESVVLHDQPGPIAEAQPLLLENAAWQVADILSGVQPPTSASAGQLAFKTGTSYGSRDAWAIGFDGEKVIGVWIGRADGTPMPGALGAELAAPLLFDAFGRLKTETIHLSAPPPSLLTVANHALPRHLQHFGGGQLINTANLEIAFPPDGAKLEIDGATGELVLKARNGQLPFTWIINGQPLAGEAHDRSTTWQTDGKGFVQISVIDASGAAARARVFLR